MNLVKTVLEDLLYLKEKWDQSIDDASLRISSPMLRRLLVDNDLQRVWKESGFEKEPQITSSTLAPIIEIVSKENITFASAGGAIYKGRMQRGASMFNITDPSIMPKLFAKGVPNATLGLHSFIEASCIVVNGQEISRRVLIKYVANKMGGAHFDISRETSENGKLFAALDTLANTSVNNKDIIYYELLSIGQAIIESADIQLLINKIQP